MSGKVIANNKKAFHDYEILERFEAGIELKGSEVKSIRLGKVNLKDSFVRIIRGEAILFETHISHIPTVNVHFKPDEKRPRKLLLKKKELDKLHGKVATLGLSIVPLSLYFNKRNWAKVEIALAKGKKLHDKRESIKKKELNREAQAAMKRNL